MKISSGLRRCFDRLGEWRAVALLMWAVLTLGVGAGQLWYLEGACKSAPVDLIRLEVAFSVERFRELLPVPEACRNAVVFSFIGWDAVFPFLYGPLLCALYLWVERWRRFAPNGSARSDLVTVPWRRDAFVIAPLLAAGLDATMENLPLWFAAQSFPGSASSGVSVWRAVAVLVASLAALLKWLLLLASCQRQRPRAV